MEKSNRYEIKVLSKALRILELFDEKGKELTVTEIQNLLGFNKASTFRILANLDQADFLEKDPVTLKYRLGYKIANLGLLAEPHSSIRHISRPFLEELNDKCGETVHLAVLNRGEALYLDKIEGQKTLRVMTRVGMKLPAHCSGVGKMLLSALSEQELGKIIREKGLPVFTENTITNFDDLKKELGKIRRQNYSVDNEEIIDGVKCAAAPLLSPEGEVLAAVSISAPSNRFNNKKAEYVSMIEKTAKKISNLIGKQ
jgi:DNA-binding IclR family transcriptional regulator